ncbi:hypothetical protein ACJMK2_033826 [Sinanodonta woodiana]|uniref:Uncharacterized protein n=1 Tax=Sinanodonta woodiana TaxID=1069815 RepID=A0ABD3WQ53_SINWO
MEVKPSDETPETAEKWIEILTPNRTNLKTPQKDIIHIQISKQFEALTNGDGIEILNLSGEKLIPPDKLYPISKGKLANNNKKAINFSSSLEEKSEVRQEKRDIRKTVSQLFVDGEKRGNPKGR